MYVFINVYTYMTAGREGLSPELRNMGRYKTICGMIYLYRYASLDLCILKNISG